MSSYSSKLALGLGTASLLLVAVAGVGGASPSAVPARAASYVVRDAGLPSFNPDVNVPSNCAQPDSDDIQTLSPPGSAANNVHNDACLFTSGASGNLSDVDVQASYQSFGVGMISACPDPDAVPNGVNGPKTAVVKDTNGDGRNDLCTQSGYQVKGTAGDREYHARLNNSTSPGQQRVIFCYDPDGDGCLDESVRSQIAIGWVAPSAR